MHMENYVIFFSEAQCRYIRVSVTDSVTKELKYMSFQEKNENKFLCPLKF